MYMPTPLNSMFCYPETIPAEHVAPTDMQVDEVIETVVSGGMVSPEVTDGMDNEKQTCYRVVSHSYIQ